MAHTLHSFLSECKDWSKRFGREFAGKLFSPDIAIAAIILLVGVGSFALGRLSALEGKREMLEVTYPSIQEGVAHAASANVPLPGGVVASKTGSKYHLPWCSGALAIKESNRIWFKAPEEARAQGYTPAANCPGIE